MAAAISHAFLNDSLSASLAQLRTADASWAQRNLDPRPALATGWEELDIVLPDHGFVHGVTELAAPAAHGGGTSLALAAIAALHRGTSSRTDRADKADKSDKAWAAWVDPLGTLYAPALAQAGVDLSRLLIVRPPLDEVRQVAVKLAASSAFSIVVVDHFAAQNVRGRSTQKTDELFVRKLGIQPCVSLLLTDQHAPRGGSLPTILRLELSRRPDAITVRVAKDRMGRAGSVKTVPLRTKPTLAFPATNSSEAAA